MSLGTRIAQARSAREMSQEQLARKINVATVTPSRWERGKNRPLPEQLPLIAEALGVPVEWLLQDEREPVSPNAAEGPFESVLVTWALGFLPQYLREHKDVVLAAMRDDEVFVERRAIQLPISRDRRARVTA